MNRLLKGYFLSLIFILTQIFSSCISLTDSPAEDDILIEAPKDNSSINQNADSTNILDKIKPKQPEKDTTTSPDTVEQIIPEIDTIKNTDTTEQKKVKEDSTINQDTPKSDKPEDKIIKKTNIPPVANAGADKIFRTHRYEKSFFSIEGYNIILRPSFDLQGEGFGSDADGSITKYEWKINDGAWVEEKHWYLRELGKRAGVVRCSLRVTDNEGDIGYDVMEVNILNPKPILETSLSAEATLPGSERVVLSVKNLTDLYGNISNIQYKFDNTNWIETNTKYTTINPPVCSGTWPMENCEAHIKFGGTIIKAPKSTGQHRCLVKVTLTDSQVAYDTLSLSIFNELPSEIAVGNKWTYASYISKGMTSIELNDYQIDSISGNNETIFYSTIRRVVNNCGRDTTSYKAEKREFNLLEPTGVFSYIVADRKDASVVTIGNIDYEQGRFHSGTYLKGIGFYYSSYPMGIATYSVNTLIKFEGERTFIKPIKNVWYCPEEWE